MLASGDRVRVNGHEGRVVGAQLNDRVYVRLDSGSGCDFPVSKVEVLPQETKAWPPRLETK